MNRRSFLLSLGAAAGASSLPLSASFAAEDNYPASPIQLIVPFPAGGTTDMMGRMMAEVIGRQLGKPVVVQNQGGAGGAIGCMRVAHAKPDGYTLLVSGIGSNAIIHSLEPKPQYDSNKDFVHISELAEGPNVFVVNPKFPAKTFQEFIAWAKANPGKFNYGQVSASSGYVTTEYLKQIAGLNMMGIGYPGGGPALIDVISDQIDGMFTNQDAVLPQVKAGSVRALAVTSLKRNPKFPDVPTVAESGYPGFNAVSWTGLSAPKGTPPAIVKKLETAMIKGFADPAVRSKLEALGFVIVTSTSEQYTVFVRDQIKLWGDVVKKAGIKTM